MKFIKVSLKILCLSGMLLFVSCSEKTEKSHGQSEIKTITCLADTSQSYNIYLPGDYSDKKTWPVIFCFDPHAKGNLPVSRLARGAEQYGYIVAGSNNSANGVQNMQYIVNTFMEDVSKNYSIDENRIYLCGFSGGARVAGSLVLTNPRYRGAIMCAAGIQMNFQLSNKMMKIYGMVGNRDFNFLEMKAMEGFLSQNTIEHYTDFFDGKHELPNDTLMFDALTWLHFKEMKSQSIPKDKNMLKAFYIKNLAVINYLEKQGKYYDALLQANRVLSYLEEIYDVSNIKKIKKSLIARDEIKQALENNKRYDQLEMKLRTEYHKIFAQRGYDWWKNELSRLNELQETEADPYKKNMIKRVVSMIGMLGYINVSNAFKDEDTEKVKELLKVYQLIDPENPDYYFFTAKYFSRINKRDSASFYLDKAIEKGFTNWTDVKNDKDLAAFANQVNEK